MEGFSRYENYSFVTAILPRESTGRVLEEVMASGAAHAMTMNARGSLIQDRWYHSLLPTLSPEQEMIFFLVPNSEADHLMEQIVMVGKLRTYGAGSIYAMPCLDLVCAEDYPLWTPGNYTFVSESFDIVFKRDLVALIHITDRNSAETITRAAIKAGAQGPTITYVRGFGLRDRLGLLRITKNHEKELITVVVDQYDVDAVFQAMAQAGRVDQPGRGLIYQVPISKGLTNLASVFQARKHSASIQQIVRAIDEMQGNANWRAKQLLIHDPKARDFEGNTRGISRNLRVLNVVSHRKDTEVLLNRLLENNVPGASLSNWRFAEATAEHTQGGLRINREFGCIMLILHANAIPPLLEVLQETIRERKMKETCFFTHEIPLVKTFTKLS